MIPILIAKGYMKGWVEVACHDTSPITQLNMTTPQDLLDIWLQCYKCLMTRGPCLHEIQVHSKNDIMMVVVS